MTKERLKELLKPIADGLFGKQRTSYGEIPHYTVREVGMIVEDLCAIPEEDWGEYAFSREPLRGKFSEEQRAELTQKAISCGREYAAKMTAEYGSSDPKILAKRLGVEADYPNMPQNASRVLFAEFREPKTVHIYMDGVRKGEELMSEPGVREALGKLDIARLLLGHELFHFIEERYRKEIWTRTYKIELWHKPFHNRSGVVVLGEIGAMAFTKELNRLSYSPYVMDAFLVYGYSPEASCGLYEEMMEKCGRTPRVSLEALLGKRAENNGRSEHDTDQEHGGADQ